MVSTVAQRKEAQDWTTDNPVCGNCEHYDSDLVKVAWGDHMKETKLRCTYGEFATKKTAWCKRWKRKEATD